jgi:hypothetical protein
MKLLAKAFAQSVTAAFILCAVAFAQPETARPKPEAVVYVKGNQ